MAARKPSDIVSGLIENFEEPEIAGPKSTQQSGVGTGNLLARHSQLADIVSGDVVEKTLLWVNPGCCRMWQRHNRRYEDLNENNCADLIEGLKAQGRQEFPSIVRALPENSEFSYEVICGARRHWAISWLRENNYPEFRFLIEIRDLSDEEAFRLGDIENRDRQDISDYERATDYLQALEIYYGGRQRSMAERLEVSESWLSKYLDLARLPDEIVGAYAQVSDIREKHARDLKPLLKNRDQRKKVVAEAKILHLEQSAAKVGEGRAIDGPEVLSKLKKAATTRPRTTAPAVLAKFETQNGKPLMVVTRSNKNTVTMKVKPTNNFSKDEFLKACGEAYDAFG